MMSLWDALRMNMMISYQELVRTFLSCSLDEAIDELLMESALKSGRSKKREAELRLEDHLRRFSLVPAEEQYIEKKVD